MNAHDDQINAHDAAQSRELEQSVQRLQKVAEWIVAVMLILCGLIAPAVALGVFNYRTAAVWWVLIAPAPLTGAAILFNRYLKTRG